MHWIYKQLDKRMEIYVLQPTATLPFKSQLDSCTLKRNWLKIWLPLSFPRRLCIFSYTKTHVSIAFHAAGDHILRPLSLYLYLRRWVKIHFVIILLCGSKVVCGASWLANDSGVGAKCIAHTHERSPIHRPIKYVWQYFAGKTRRRRRQRKWNGLEHTLPISIQRMDGKTRCHSGKSAISVWAWFALFQYHLNASLAFYQ